jgi:hypothetical protein
MRTRALLLSFASCLLGAVLCPVAGAASSTVNVRIEGRSETLFEGPLEVEGHDVRASSDTSSRRCDGINPNDPQNTTPGPTPTSASADAISIAGQSFDGDWYPGYEDYFLTRWGPDAEAEGRSWGLLVNDVFTSVGGCQYLLDTGDEVLWVYDAFAARPELALYRAGDEAGPRALTATATLGQPFAVEVREYEDGQEDAPPPFPQRTGSAPFAGALVSPVVTAPNGFERIEAASPTTATSDAQGKATLTFDQPGWHRIKAAALHEGEETAIRSNRLDVCVPAQGASDCGTSPSEDQVRNALHGPFPEQPAAPSSPSGASPPGTPPAAPPATSANGGHASESSSPVGSAATLAARAKAAIRHDDGWRGLHYGTGWRRTHDRGAGQHTLHVGGRGARVWARLPAGRVLFVIRASPQPAWVELSDGSHEESRVLPEARGARGLQRLVIGASSRRAGTVTLRVLRGRVALDGVWVEP